MKKLRTALFSSLMLIGMSISIAQMQYWTMPDRVYSMTSSNPTASGISGASTPYSVANGVYNEFGTLLFYVQDNFVYDRNSNQVGELGIGNASSCTNNQSILNTEIVIVPIPETCAEYYVFYGMDSPAGISVLLYTKVDVSSGSPVVINNGSVFRSCFYPNIGTISGTYPIGFKVNNHAGSDHLGIAVSKEVDVAGTRKRYLYTVNFDGIRVSEISTSGVTAGALVADYNTLGLSQFSDFFSYELELSHGGNFLAWTSTNNEAYVIEVNGASYVSGSIQTYTLDDPKGLEFNNSIQNPRLYVSYGSGVTEIDIQNQLTQPVNTNGYDLSNTYLEYARNGKIYGVGPEMGGNPTDTYLVGIDAANNISPVPLGLDCRYDIAPTYYQGVYTLPDQIDGENYTSFNGFDDIGLEFVSLGGAFLNPSCNGRLSTVCADDLILNIGYGGTPIGHNISVYSMNNCQLGNLLYSNGFASGAPALNTNLSSLLNITTTTRLFVEVRLFGGCDEELSASGYIDVIVPVPPVTKLEIYDYTNSQVYLSPSTDINNPVMVGAASIGYRINNSTGTINDLRIEVEEVDNSGNVVQLIYDETINVNGVSSYTYENLNGSLCVPTAVWGGSNSGASCTINGNAGFNGYFSYQAAVQGPSYVGTRYKLTITLSNQCNSSTAFSYLEIEQRFLRKKSTTASIENADMLSLNVYPNPANDQLNIETQLDEDQSLEISMFDAQGRLVKTLMNNSFVQKGEFRRTFNISKLPKGMYIYRVQTNNESTTGRIVVQ